MTTDEQAPDSMDAYLADLGRRVQKLIWDIEYLGGYEGLTAHDGDCIRAARSGAKVTQLGTLEENDPSRMVRGGSL